MTAVRAWFCALWICACAGSLAQAADVVLSPHAAGGGRLLKGQLHCHSSATDGAQSPREVFEAYAAAGYDFVCLSDHLTITGDPRVAGVTWIPAAEVHTRAADDQAWDGQHLNVLGLRQVPQPGWDRARLAPLLEQVAAAGGLAMANHPRVRNRWTTAQLTAAGPLQLVSVFNTKGYRRANRTLPGAGDVLYATAWHWDQVLSAGGLLWGVAADDCHDVGDPSQFDQGWVRVRAPSADAEAVLAALRRGDVYACRGPGGLAPALTVEVVPSDAGWLARARSETPGVRLRWISGGAVLEEGPGPSLTVPVAPGLDHLRAEAQVGRDRVTYAQPCLVVRDARIAAGWDGERWSLTLRDGQDRPVRTLQALPLRVGQRSYVLPGGATTLWVPPGAAHVGDRVQAPGWPQSRLVR